MNGWRMVKKSVMATSMLVATVLAMLTVPEADAGNQVTVLSVPLATTQASLVNVTNTVNTTAMFALPQGVDVWFTPILSTTNTGVSNVWFTVNTSPDGINISTTSPLVFSAACAGSNLTSITPIRYASTNFTGLSKAQVTTVGTSQTNQVTVSLLMSFQTP